MTRLVAALAAFVAICAAVGQAADIYAKPDMSWEKDYANWRSQEEIDLGIWADRMPAPRKSKPPRAEFDEMSVDEKQSAFYSCLEGQIAEFGERITSSYRSPKLGQVREAVVNELANRGLSVTVAIFWGRERYVSMLWQYLERNLRKNQGIVDKIVLVTRSRDQDEDGTRGSRRIINEAKSKYPDVVSEFEMCIPYYGCAFDRFLTDTQTVYVKIDDDIIFIKDGSIEALVWQVLFNPHYSLYSGSVVNNPHGYAVHAIVGALPPVLYHWPEVGPARPPHVPRNGSGEFYYGKNMYDSAGSRAHEGFIYNAAAGRLDVYAFDMWNMNECRCGRGQIGLDMCSHGYYRWNVNVFAYTKNATNLWNRTMPGFDEPAIGMGWPMAIPPHRVGMAGEALFVHYQYTLQRMSKPDFGLREDVLLPWYNEFTRQYMAHPWGTWQGNASLLTLHENLSWNAGENRFASYPKRRKPEDVQPPSIYALGK